jgi:anti-sigma factor RsiW
MNMRCEIARTLLVSLADREPSGLRAGELTRHLEQCAECHALLEALKQDREILRGMPATEPPERLLDRVMTQVRQTEPVTRRSLPRLLRVAAIILLFLTGIALGVVIGYTISPRDTHPIDRIAVLMMSEPTENQSEVQ